MKIKTKTKRRSHYRNTKTGLILVREHSVKKKNKANP